MIQKKRKQSMVGVDGIYPWTGIPAGGTDGEKATSMPEILLKKLPPRTREYIPKGKVRNQYGVI